MVDRFLRPPSGPAELAADALRVLAGIGVVVAAVFFGPTDAGVLAFVLPGLLLPRLLGVRAGFDLVYSGVLLVAGWSNVLDLYTSVAWWDVVVHLTCTAVIALMLYLLLAELGIVPPPARAGSAQARPAQARPAQATAVVLTAALGLAVSALWEMVEWFGHAFISSEIFVEYDDTIGDMAVGGLGAVMAGVVLARVRLLRRDEDAGG
ncbi:hypothetical protein [Herbiconiux sp.]|uniref:hypothetical protein n=1 Tax=Herbiconiux sp. TaxID=1871186 RepID=UPI0025BAD291|nr:hypothetical protein [Herbiconiux sp.]